MAFDNNMITREDCMRMYNNHVSEHNQGYYKTMQKFAESLSSLVGGSPFSKEAWGKIIENDALFNKAKAISCEMFSTDKVVQGRFNRLMDNSREIAISCDKGSYSLEGWGGGTAVYASSQGAFAMGATPFIIGGWLASARSEEIFQHIDNKNSMRLEFEYNIDYLQVGDKKFYFPQAFRSGEIVGYNKLPEVDWVTPNTDTTGTYTKPEAWCGEKMFIEPNVGSGSVIGCRGNLLEVAKRNKHKYGIEPNFRLTAIKFADNFYDPDDETKETYKVNATPHYVTKRVQLNYGIATGKTNERYVLTDYVLENVPGFANPIKLNIHFKVNLDTGDFQLAVQAGNAEEISIIKGFQFLGRVSNEANELTNIPTTGTDKYQFIRECEYRNYAKVSLNEYMADNFRIGSNNNISYAAYASDKMLQYTIFNRELEAEEFLINDVLDDTVDLNTMELTNKLGGFINNNLSFTIGRFAPGMHLQDYKEGLKTYLTKVLATSDTDLNLPSTVKREWILLGYDALVTEFPEVKYENAAVNLAEAPEGSQVNEHFGFATDTKCGFVDSLGRSVRIIGNTDIRWRERGNNIYGTLRTYSMEYPFLVYYPHAIRMFTAIDADMPNRTAIYLGGREFRGHFAACAIQLALNGVMDGSQQIINNFDVQMANAKETYKVESSVSGTITNTVATAS